MNRKLGQVSLATAMSVQPSLLKSAATTPMPLASGFPIPEASLTSVKVPSRLLVELDVLAFVVAWMAVGAVARTMFAAPQVVFGRPVDVVQHHQVEVAVAVVVEPG